MATKKTNTTKSDSKRLITEAEMAEAERNTGKLLAGQPKVKIMIAPDEKDPVWRGSINGYRFAFPKGQMIEVPRDLAIFIEQRATMAYEQKQLEEQLKAGMEL